MRQTIVSLLMIPLVACVADVRDQAADEAAARRAADAYVAAWLANDSSAVLATLTDDAVLLPAGANPVSGAQAIRAFWWPPDQPATRVTAYDNTVDDLEVSGDLAYVRGSATLTFAWEQDGAARTATNRSAYLMVLRRTEAAGWKIARRMWARLPGP